jgi:hypothetical protein
MKSLLKRITGDQRPAEGDATGFPQAVANSVHSLFQRISGPAMPSRTRDEVCYLKSDLAYPIICAGEKLQEMLRTGRLFGSSMVIRAFSF